MKAIYANSPPPIATFSYDLLGKRLTLALNNGVTNGYTYDTASRLTALVAKQGLTPVASFNYGYNLVNNRTSAQREDSRLYRHPQRPQQTSLVFCAHDQ